MVQRKPTHAATQTYKFITYALITHFGNFGNSPLKKTIRDTALCLVETGCENGEWMELSWDRVHLRALILVMLNLRVMLADSWSVIFRNKQRNQNPIKIMTEIKEGNK